MEELTKCRYMVREMELEFQKMKDIFLDVRDFIYPSIGELDDDLNQQGKRHDEFMLRTSPIKYANVLAAGLQSGITSPTRRWIKLKFPDKQVMADPDVKAWLTAVEDVVLAMLSKGKFYQENQQFYLELGCFATAAMFIEENTKTGLSCSSFTCGEYSFGLDADRKPNRFCRTIAMTREQIMEKFGVDVCSGVASSYGSVNNRYKVKHLITPNEQQDRTKKDKSGMAFSEYYWVEGRGTGSADDFLSVGGYHEFPVTIGRWSAKSSDVFGSGSPGIWSLGDAKQIQIQWRDIMSGVELGVKPPMQAPSDILANGGINLMPAAANYYNPTGNNDGGIRPVFENKLDIASAISVQTETEECIKDHFNYKVFQMLSDMDKGTRTAREIVELAAEKMGQMGSLVDRMETEILPQTVERVLAIGFRAGVFPPAPQSIQGMNMDVEYESILSQAQRQNQITPIIDTVTEIINMAATSQMPEILDKVDFDVAVSAIGDLNGVPPGLIRSDSQVEAIRQARAQQQQQMNAAAMAAQSAQTAKTASQADLSGNNALTQVLGGAVEGVSMP